MDDIIAAAGLSAGAAYSYSLIVTAALVRHRTLNFFAHDRAMAKAHLDRRELAELTGYSEAQIVGWERGHAPLYPTELIRLCHALDVMPEWLLCWKRRLHG